MLSLSSLLLLPPQSHRRQHNKDKPFKCHNCHRAYTDAASLEVHLATHTVKHAKVYTCSICSRAYTSVSVCCPGGQQKWTNFPGSSSSRSNGGGPLSCRVPSCWLWRALSPPLTRFFPLQETYLMKHMRKHNIPDPQQQVVQAQAQASQAALKRSLIPALIR